jgi:hypothetical protein
LLLTANATLWKKRFHAVKGIDPNEEETCPQRCLN